MTNTHLAGGFENPSRQSADIFRNIMTAMARPGTCNKVSGIRPPAPLSPSAGAIILTLCDGTTPIFLSPKFDCDDVRNWIAFHTGAPIVARQACEFAIGEWAELLPMSDYPIGTSEYPDRSATIIAELPSLTTTGATLTGPGIKDSANLSLPETAIFQSNRQQFPLGWDFIFTCCDIFAALPRSTEVS